jgi:hypothetical protein
MNSTTQKYLAGAAILAAWYALVVLGKLPAEPLQNGFMVALGVLGGHGTITSLFNLFSGATQAATAGVTTTTLQVSGTPAVQSGASSIPIGNVAAIGAPAPPQ